MPFRKITLLTIALLALAASTRAQITISSPYSRFGLGDLNTNNNAWNFSMGRTGIALRSSSHVNYINPAAYTAFDSSTFVFEGGFNSNYVTLTSNLQKNTRNYASVGYINFGFPIARWWRTSVSLLPYSDVGYNIADETTHDSLGSIVRLYQGEGGINRLMWGNGFRIFRDLSVGFNFAYLFGNMTRKASLLYPDSVYYANVRAQTFITLNDIYLTYGIQYHRTLKNDMNLTVGAIFAPSSNIRAKTDYLAQTYYLTATGTENIKDTIAIGEGFKGRISIPWLAGGGVSIGKADKWTATVDGKWQNWKNFKAFGYGDSLVNSWEVNAGAEFIPDMYGYSSYFKRIRYRIGFSFQETYLMLRGHQLADYSASIGMGFPLKGNKTLINLGAQVGSRGTTQDNLIKESYFRFIIGFSIADRWFVKRKYY